jgi:hypothetical protein
MDCSYVLRLRLRMDIVVRISVRCVDKLERGEEGAEIGPAWRVRGLRVCGGGNVVLDWGDVSVSLGVVAGSAQTRLRSRTWLRVRWAGGNASDQLGRW